MTHQKKIIRFILGKYFPKIFARPFYAFHIFAVTLITKLLLTEKSEIWLRHSYYLGNWRPFISDIDFSLWTDLSASDPKLRRWLKAFLSLKKIFPLIGEVNIYWHNGVLAPWINPVELKKDPLLAKKLYPQPRHQPDDFEKLAFQLKYINANCTDLLDKRYLPYFRSEKWNFYFSLLEEQPNSSLSAMTVWEHFRASLRNQEDFEALQKFFTFLARGIDRKHYPIDPVIKTYFANHFYDHDYCNYLPSSDWSKKWQQALLKWEIWGLGTHISFHLDNPKEKTDLYNHAEALKRFSTDAETLRALKTIQQQLQLPE